MRRRTRAREAAMQFLYQLDLRSRAGVATTDPTATDRSAPARGRLDGRTRSERRGVERRGTERRLGGRPEDGRNGEGAEHRIAPLTAREIDQCLTEFLDDAEAQGQLKDEDGRAFTRRLVKGALQHKDEIDRILRRVARNWNLERMAAVDRNVLRMAVYELLHCAEVPPKVTINEAIEIAKRYSTANSGGFVNGIIDRIRIDHEQGRLHRLAAEPTAEAGAEDLDGTELPAGSAADAPPRAAESGSTPSAARPLRESFSAPRMPLPRLPLPRPLSDS